MATYEYTARTTGGEKVAGVMQADSETAVVRTLDERELYPIRVAEQAERSIGSGRGKRMYPDTGHDVGVFREIVGDVPLSGFFCGGEFGQVGGRNFVHGFSTSIAMFREKPA